MKKLFLLFLILGSLLCFSQTGQKDILILQNYDRVIGVIIEDHHPDYIIFKSEAFGEMKIDYNQILKINSFRAALPKEKIDKKKEEKKKLSYLSIGSGLGYSYGGIGVRIQHTIYRKTGWAFSLGLGYNEYLVIPSSYKPRYEDSGVAFAFGVKFYPYKWYYINLNYLFNSGNISEREIHDLADFSLLLGVDYLAHKNWGINAALGISAYNNNFIIDFDSSNGVDLNQLAIDFGAYYKFKSKK